MYKGLIITSIDLLATLELNDYGLRLEYNSCDAGKDFSCNSRDFMDSILIILAIYGFFKCSFSM